MSLVRTTRRRMLREGMGRMKERVRVMNLSEAADLPASLRRKLALAALPVLGGFVKRHIVRKLVNA